MTPDRLASCAIQYSTGLWTRIGGFAWKPGLTPCEKGLGRPIRTTDRIEKFTNIHSETSHNQQN
jgi:hypothetical protein